MCRDQYWLNQDLEEIFIGSLCCHSSSDSFFPGGIFHPKTSDDLVEIQDPRWNVLLLEPEMKMLLDDIRAKREGPSIEKVEDVNQNGRVEGNNDNRIFGEIKSWAEKHLYSKDTDR